MNVAVLTTGRAEWHGLAAALDRLLPGHDFRRIPTQEQVDSFGERMPYDGSTSTPLAPGHERRPPEAARELVRRAAQAAPGRGRRDEGADLVVIVDDVELANIDRIDRIARVMRRAATAHLEGMPDRFRETTRRALRDRVSFHLVSPMVEAWFFADPKALETAGVQDLERVHFDGATDPEHFETADSAYLAASEKDCPALDGLRGKKLKKHRPKWLGHAPRERHPKGYLQWLCIDPRSPRCTRYNESEHGGSALSAIDWSRLLGRPAHHFSMLRALVEDVADALATDPVVPIGGPASPLLSRHAIPPDPVLRNL